jgi:hypothetical protein
MLLIRYLDTDRMTVQTDDYDSDHSVDSLYTCTYSTQRPRRHELAIL